MREKSQTKLSDSASKSQVREIQGDKIVEVLQECRRCDGVLRPPVADRAAIRIPAK